MENLLKIYGIKLKKSILQIKDVKMEKKCDVCGNDITLRQYGDNKWK